MTEHEDTIVVFTARSPERVVREGGSQSWVLNAVRAKNCQWLVCTQNRHNPDHEFSDATEPHGAGFLVGKVSAIRPSQEPGDADRWQVAISKFARIDKPDLWDHGRNPVRYTSLAALGIDPTTLNWQPMPQAIVVQPAAGVMTASGTPPAGTLTIADAKKALAATFGVDPDAIEITIRG